MLRFKPEWIWFNIFFENLVKHFTPKTTNLASNSEKNYAETVSPIDIKLDQSELLFK